MAANSEVVGLTDTYINYGVESTFGTAIATTLMFGGLIQSVNFDVDVANTEHAGMVGTGLADGRVTAKFTPGVVSTKCDIDFKAQTFDWLEYALLGVKAGSGTVATPYTYALGRLSKSLTLCENIDNAGTDSKRTYAGMVIDSWTIRCATGEAVNVSLSLKGGKIAATTTVSAAVAQGTGDLFNFAGGTIEMPDATPIGNVIDSAEFTGNNNWTLAYGFNREAQNGKPGRLNLGLKFSCKYLDDDQLTRLLGSATAVTSQTPVTLSLKFTKGTNLYVDFVFTNVVINRLGDAHNLNEFMVESADLLAATLVVTEAEA